MLTERVDLNAIANAVMDDIWADALMYTPVYVQGIRSEAQAEAMSRLPLMYIWNEVVEDGMLRSYSFSINGPIVGALLEKRLPRSHPAFAGVRNAIVKTLQTSQHKVVMENCIEAQQQPSRLYGKKLG